MAGSFRALFIMPNIDALIATGATLDTLVEVTADDPNNTWTFSSLNKVVPKIGSIIVLKDGSLARVRGKFFRFLLLELPSGNRTVVFFNNEKFGSAFIEPNGGFLIKSPPFVAIFFILISRFLLLFLVDRLSNFLEEGFLNSVLEIWTLAGIIIMVSTYVALSIIHRSQWQKLATALPELTPDWLPRLSKDIGGVGIAISFSVLVIICHLSFELSSLTLIFGLGFFFLDIMPIRKLPSVISIRRQCRIPSPKKDNKIQLALKRLLMSSSEFPLVLKSDHPERLLLGAEVLVEQGVELTVLGPDPEFLPGTVRDNFAWEESEVADNHFRILMEYVGLDAWRSRFGANLNYRIGHQGQGLASSEAARLAVARALAQGARRLILVDALAALSAHEQWKLCERLVALGCRVVIFSSMSDEFQAESVEIA